MGSKGGVVSIVRSLIAIQRNAPRRESCLTLLFLRKSLLTRVLILPCPPDGEDNVDISCGSGQEIGVGVKDSGQEKWEICIYGPQRQIYIHAISWIEENGNIEL